MLHIVFIFLLLSAKLFHEQQQTTQKKWMQHVIVSVTSVNIPQCAHNSDSFEETLKENQQLRAEVQQLKETVISYNDSDCEYAAFAWYQMQVQALRLAAYILLYNITTTNCKTL